MPVTVNKIENTNAVEVIASGKLHHEDYEHFVPELEGHIQEHGKIRILFRMGDFHGWSLGAMWDDMKFGYKHFSQIERVAMVGDKSWEKGMAIFCKPFTRAKIHYFDIADEEKAREWLLQTAGESHAEENSKPEDYVDISQQELDPADLVRVYTLHDAGLADIIANALRSEGIPCTVGDELQAGLTGIFEIDLYVRSIDADRARAFIATHEKEHKITL